MASFKVISDIVADYKRDALQHKNRVQAALDRDPGLAEIDREINAVGFQLLGHAFDGGDVAPLVQSLDELKERKKRQMRGVPQNQDMCARCHDEGMLDGEFCTCLRQRIYREHYGALDPLDAPLALEKYATDVFDDDEPTRLGLTPRRLAVLARHAAERVLADSPGPTKSLLVSGPAGTGKTWLVSALARSLAEKGVDVCFIHATAFFEVYHQVRLGEPMDSSYLERAQVLVLDDLGTEPLTRNVTQEALLRVLKARDDADLPTIVTTNEQHLQSRYGERISSRLFDRATYDNTIMGGTDLRRKPAPLF